MCSKLVWCTWTCFFNTFISPYTTSTIIIKLSFTFIFRLKVFTNFIFASSTWLIHLALGPKCLTLFLSFYCTWCLITLFSNAFTSYIIPLTIRSINIFNTSNSNTNFRTGIIFSTTTSTSSNTILTRKISLAIFICFLCIWSIITSFFLTTISIISSTYKQELFTLFVCG